jgi:hypothetical protein
MIVLVVTLIMVVLQAPPWAAGGFGLIGLLIYKVNALSEKIDSLKK